MGLSPLKAGDRLILLVARKGQTLDEGKILWHFSRRKDVDINIDMEWFGPPVEEEEEDASEE